MERGDESFIEQARTRIAAPLAGRDRSTSVLSGGAFLAVALALPALLPAQPASLLVAALLVACHAVASRVEFEVGPGSAVPTQVVLVPMLLLLPPAVVPLCVAAGYLLGGLVDYATGRVHPQRSFVLLSYSWHAVGPALVLALLAPGEPAWSHAPVYLAALGAQFAFDFASSAAREKLAFGVSPRELVPFLTWVYAIDALLAPVGVLAALAAGRAPIALLLVLPLLALLALLARDRRARIDRALEFNEAYRGASREARSDPLTGLANRLAWEEALDREEAHRHRPAAVVLVDLDGLKAANDTRGHGFGDELLRAFAGIVRGGARAGDLVARVGGDELAVLMLDAQPDACVETVARISHALGAHPGVDGFPLSAALGYGTCPPAASLREAERRADASMYLQKQQARDALLSVLRERDVTLDEHSQGVAELAVAVGTLLGMRPHELDDVARAAELHDVGKLAIAEAILQKPGPLTDEERDAVERHPLIGERILAAVPALRTVAPLVRASHERYDGHGYPDGRAGEEIPLGARIIFVCDAFHAMTSERPYDPMRRTDEQAVAELRRCARTQFDPLVVEQFCAVLTDATRREAGRTAIRFMRREARPRARVRGARDALVSGEVGRGTGR